MKPNWLVPENIQTSSTEGFSVPPHSLYLPNISFQFTFIPLNNFLFLKSPRSSEFLVTLEWVWMFSSFTAVSSVSCFCLPWKLMLGLLKFLNSHNLKLFLGQWFLGIALRFPTAHDFRVISEWRWTPARAEHNIRDFPQAKSPTAR